MAIAVGNSTSGLTTTITRPASASGDYIIAVALRDGSNNPPNIPTGWTAIQTKTGDSTGAVLAYIVSDGSTPTETFGSATSVVMTAYSGVTGLGASGQTTTIGTTINWGALTLTGTNGGSWIVLGAVTRADGTTVSAETPPSGFVNRVVSTDTTDESALHDSNGGVSSFAGASASIGGASTGNVGFALELLGAPSGGGGTTVSGAGSSAGAASASGGGASTAAAAGSSSAVAAASGTGASDNAAAGSSAGVATASGGGASISAGAGSSSGAATVSGAGASTSPGIAAGDGSAVGSATVSGVGASIAAAAGTASSSSTAAAVGLDGSAPVPTARQPDGDILPRSKAGRTKPSGVRPSQRDEDPRTALQRLADGYRASAVERLIDRFKAAQQAVEQAPATPAREEVQKAVSEARKALPAVQEVPPAFDWQALLDEMEQAARAQADREQQLALMRQAIAQAEQVKREIEDEEEAFLLLMA